MDSIFPIWWKYGKSGLLITYLPLRQLKDACTGDHDPVDWHSIEVLVIPSFSGKYPDSHSRSSSHANTVGPASIETPIIGFGTPQSTNMRI